jgi:hypothetical protein
MLVARTHPIVSVHLVELAMSVDDNERPSKGGGKYRSWQLICFGCLHDAINTAPFFLA